METETIFTGVNRSDPKRHVYFITLLLVGVVVFSGPLRRLAALSFESELYSHVLLIPVVSLYVFWVNRKQIFAETSYSLPGGAMVLAAGILFYAAGSTFGGGLSQNDFLSLKL